jgi:hypothetical protein
MAFDTNTDILIRTDTGIQSSFIRANSHLISQNTQILSLANTAEEKNQILKQLWATKFNARIVDGWEFIRFDQDQDRTMFLLQWG